MSCKRKLDIYTACVVSKLLYNLNTVWLSAVARRRLDGFHARCLRQILRIPPAFVSRVSNGVVFRTAGMQPMTDILLRQQLTYFGRIARMPAGSAVQDVVFDPGTLRLRSTGRRRKGTPENHLGSGRARARSEGGRWRGTAGSRVFMRRVATGAAALPR